MKKYWEYIRDYFMKISTVCKNMHILNLLEMFKVRENRHILIAFVYFLFFYLLDYFEVLSRLLHDTCGGIFVSHPTLSWACVLWIIFEIIWLLEHRMEELSRISGCAVTRYSYTTFLLPLLLCGSLFIYQLVPPSWQICAFASLVVLFLRDDLQEDVLEIIQEIRPCLAWCLATSEQPHQPVQQTSRKIKFLDLKKDVYDNKHEIVRENTDAPILLLDEDVNYDLLERRHVIENLEEVIRNYIPQSSFVIGLEGEWGSGKSTIIKNVKEKLNDRKQDYIIIDSFKPWLYNDTETLLRGMFDAILKDSDINYGAWQRRRYMALIDELMSKNSFTYYLSALLSKPQSLNAKLEDTNKRINKYLIENDKVIVFFIDEIDRALPENILLLFKTLSVILDLEKIIYVLAYDPVQMSKILRRSLKLDSQFLEKIVQMKIKVDAPSSKSQFVYETCLRKILEGYKESDKSLEEDDYRATRSHICSAISNVREFKRFINSALSTAMLYGKGLYKPNLLALEYIKYADNELYQKLYDNRYFLVSCGISSHDDALKNRAGIDDLTEFINLRAEFIQGLRSDNKNARYIKILEDMFPRIYNNTAAYFDKFKDKISKNAGIASVDFVDLYFTYAANDHIEIKKKVEQFIEEIEKLMVKNISSVDEASRSFEEQVQDLSFYEQTIWIENFCLLTKDLTDDKALFVVKMLFESVYRLKENLDRHRPSPLNSAVSHISTLLMNVDNNSLKMFMAEAVLSYSKLNVIVSIMYYVREKESTGSVLDCIKVYYKNMCESVVKGKIDLYSDENYRFHNSCDIFSFYRHAPEIICSYLLGVVSKDNIYRILGDFAACVLREKDYYLSLANNVRLLLIGKKHEPLTTKLDDILRVRPTRTESERLVLEVYKNKDKLTSGTETGDVIRAPYDFHFEL